MRRGAWLACFAVALLGCAAQRPREGAPRTPPTGHAAAESVEPTGVGTLEARRPTGDGSMARLAQVHVSARQLGDMAEVEATHTFHNDSDSVVEGTFRFPLPDGALLTGLALMIDGKLEEGELVEREKARKTYEAIVDGMQDPALLEWEHGNVFKMRVFPLEPRADKVVVVRYLAPLWREGNGWSFVQGARGAEGGQLTVDWQGERISSEREAQGDLVVRASARPPGSALRESRADGSYAVVRLRPDGRRARSSAGTAPKTWFIVVDTSRSALEELPLELEALTAVLSALPAGSQFQVVTSDVEARPSPQGLRAVSPAAIRDAIDFVRRSPPDGASDLGRALRVVGELAGTTSDRAVVYLGDGEPTWGLTEPTELAAQLRRELPGTPFVSLLLGASVGEELAEELAVASGGSRTRVRRRPELDAVVRTLSEPLSPPVRVELHAPAGTEILTHGAAVLEPGRDLLLYLRASPGSDPLRGVTARVKRGGATVDLMPRSVAVETPGVAQRFGAARVHALEKSRAPAPELVKASLAYGVMSKLTSFLVLESEEAYARFAIERRRASTADAPRVTGSNLESPDGADITVNRVQPGDPEIVVDAALDAVSVTVELPSGETKVAVYDPEARGGRGAWGIRFLVALGTPEGSYDALVLIQHADGRLETRTVSYTVDGTGPELEVRLSPARGRPGWVEARVTQSGEPSQRDLKRVELRTPAGAVHQLTAIRWGEFRALLPREELTSGTLRVVGFDQALNHTVKELSLP